jgi:arsenite-transporting ATPase
MRLILYTGKGGVGKSSIAAATAVSAAEQGRRTLLVSSDVAHNISDIFDCGVGSELTQVCPNLTALEVDPLKEIRENWAPAHDYFTAFLAYLGMDNPIAEEIALVPGIDEFFLLTRILREVESNRYDVIVVDCSPTAGTMRLLTFTDSACTKLNKLMDVERKIMKLVRPVGLQIKSVRELIPSDEVYGVFDEVIQKVGRLGGILKDPEVSSVRLVLNPDRVAIAETRRAFTYFGLFGFPVDSIFVNKVLPPELAKGYLQDWFVLQQKLLETIAQSFLDVAQFQVPLFDHEPIGLAPLSKVAGDMFRDRKPDDMLSEPRSVFMAGEVGKPQIEFWLPNLPKESIDVQRKDAELILKAGGYTRVFSLPDTLLDSEVAGAQFSQGKLTITFK